MRLVVQRLVRWGRLPCTTAGCLLLLSAQQDSFALVDAVHAWLAQLGSGKLPSV